MSFLLFWSLIGGGFSILVVISPEDGELGSGEVCGLEVQAPIVCVFCF